MEEFFGSPILFLSYKSTVMYYIGRKIKSIWTHDPRMLPYVSGEMSPNILSYTF